MVKAIKQGFKRSLGGKLTTKHRRFTLEELRVVLKECCNKVNDQPLTRVPTDDKNPSSRLLTISPNMLVRGRNSTILDERFRLTKKLESNANLVDVNTMYKERQAVLAMFSDAFMSTYLHSLTVPKKFPKTFDGKIEKGTLLLLQEKKLGKTKFTPTIVEEVIYHLDRKISRCRVRTAQHTGTIEREIHAFSLSECDYM